MTRSEIRKSQSPFGLFLREVPLILGVEGKLKKKTRDIYKRTIDIEFERDRSIGLGSTIGDGQTDRQTDRQTHTHTYIFSKTYLHTLVPIIRKNIKKRYGHTAHTFSRLMSNVLI